MKLLSCLVLIAPLCAQSFTLEQVMDFSFPMEMAAAPTGGAVAWVSQQRGVRNVSVASPPDYRARRVTAYSADDGQEVMDLRWAAGALVYVHGEDANRTGEVPNPTSNPAGVEQAIWVAPLDGPPRRLAEGHAPAVSPRGDRVAFLRRGQVWLAPLDGKGEAVQLFRARGQSLRLAWSPDSTKLAFESDRGDHAFIGVYDLTAKSLRYLDPSTGSDGNPEWSPDSRRVAFIRMAPRAKRILGPRRSAEPWSLRVADASTGEAREVWCAAAGPGSAFRAIDAATQIFWTAGDRIIFPWERDGWTHLYSVPADGGDPLLLTPGAFEVEHVSLAPDRRQVLYSSNQDDLDRRHLWQVGAAGGKPVALTAGTGIEWMPVMTSDGKLAYFRSDAQRPAHPVIRRGGAEAVPLEPVPAGFPVQALVTPQQVIFPAADGLQIHGQLFLPKQTSAKRAPAVVFFHGGSRRQMLLGWHYRFYYHNSYAMNQYLTSLGYVVLSVNFRSGTGYGLDFREALNYGYAGASEFNDVQGAGLYLRSRADVDPARIGVWGGSYGGYLTALALARASHLFAAGVDFHGVHDWASEIHIDPLDPAAKIAFQSSPMAAVDTWRSPVLLIHGDDDRNVEFNQTVMLAEALRRRKVEYQEIIYPDEIHDLLVHQHWVDAYRAAARFFEKHLVAK